MQKYSYRAYDSAGKAVKGTLVAQDEKNFRDLLHEQGMRLYEYRLVNQAKKVANTPLKVGELIAFSRQLSSMLSSGLDLSLSLKMLYERTEKNKKHLKQVEAQLKAAGLRVETDMRNEKIGYKIREAQLEKLPYMLIIGDKEKEEGTVSVRMREKGDIGAMPLADFAARVKKENDEKTVF